MQIVCMFKIIIVLITIIAITNLVQFAHADLISIIRSNSCIILKCISVKELLKYDNSTQYISGKFVFNEKINDYIRLKGMKNSIDYYKNSKDSIVFVQPDLQTLMRTKKITIEPHLQEYVLIEQKNKKEIDHLTDVRYTSNGIYANSGCTEITIGIKQVSVDYALEYIANDCVLGKNPIVNKIVTNKTQIAYCGNNCQYIKFMKEAKVQSKKLQIGKNNEIIKPYPAQHILKDKKNTKVSQKHHVVKLYE